MPATILAIETATEACSAALLNGDEMLLEYQLAPRQHTQLILPMVHSLLDKAGFPLAQVNAIAFGKGPGAFTGLRIAAGVTQGLAFAHDLPVIPISTLAAMALQVCEKHTDATDCLVAIDARIQEVYWGHYQPENGAVALLGKEQVIAPARLEKPPVKQAIAAGTGWSSYAEELQSLISPDTPVVPEIYPSAEHIAKLAMSEFEAGRLFPAEQAVPVYLRDKVADTIAERAQKQ